MKKQPILSTPNLPSGDYAVVRIIARLNVGGPAQHVVQLTRGLASSYPTLLVTGELAEGEAEFALPPDIHVYRIPELGRRIRVGQDLVAFAKLFRLLRQVRPRIVHTHTAKAGALGRIAAVMAGVPIRIHTFHGHVFRGYFGPAMNRAVVQCERLLARLTGRVVAISESQAQELCEVFRICRRDRIAVVPLGLNLEPFIAVRHNPELRAQSRDELKLGECRTILSVGRLVPIKNHGLLLRACARLAAAGVDFRLLIVGGGTEETALRRAAGSLGISKQVQFLGWRTDLPRLYAAADVVALSSDNEGTPVCLIEALAAGVPVVATRVGGVPDVLENERLGLLVEPGDAESLAQALSYQLVCPLRAAAASVVNSRYGIARLLADMTDLYRGTSAPVARRVHHASSIPQPGLSA